MRVVFLSPYLPWPVRTGGQNRVLELLRAITRFAEVELLAVGDPRRAVSARGALASLGVSVEVHPATGPGPGEHVRDDVERPPDAAAHFRSPSLAAALRERVRFGDLVHVEELAMAQYLEGLELPVVAGRQKVEWAFHAALAGACAGERADWNRREAERFRRWERMLAGRFDALVATGEADRRLLAEHHAPERLHVAPLSVGERFALPDPRSDRVDEVLLYGALDYPPNELANALYFEEIWPLLRQAAPRLRTAVIGSGTPPPSLPASGAGVEVAGSVADVERRLAGAGALAVPLRVGGGARTKVLEALACGMPVVSTALGVENLDLEPGRHVLLAETPRQIADALLKLRETPELVRALGREGAARVDERHRAASLAAALEPLYRGLVERARRPASRARPRVLLVGVAPWPSDAEARGHTFPGHRSEQFHGALLSAGCDVEGLLLGEEPDAGPLRLPAGVRALGADDFAAGAELRRTIERFRPDAVVAAGGFHAARAVAGIPAGPPRWIDLPGDLAAEGQLRALRSGPAHLLDYLAVLERALHVGDRFSAVGPSQRLALLGQLGLAGRLGPDAAGDEPVAVVPLASVGPQCPPPLPASGLTLLWAGGFNTWMDEDTLIGGLEAAMARRPELRFVATGGDLPGHAGEPMSRFRERVGASSLAGRFEERGRLPRRAAHEALAESHALLAISAPSLEAELGSRQRVVEGLAWGRPAVLTGLGDLAREIDSAGAGITVAPGDPAALAAAIERIADRTVLEEMARRARTLWETRFEPVRVTEPLRAWAQRPRRGPAPAAARAGLEARWLAAEAQLAAIRRSRSFRLLRLVDRLLGRSSKP